MRVFSSISRSPLGEAGEDPLVGQLRAVKLNLYLFAVDPDISGDPEGDGILDPGLGRPPLGQLPLEILALVVLGVLHEQAFRAEELRGLGELRALRARELDPDLGEPAPLGACAVELEEPGELREGERDHVQVTAEHEPERVLVGGAPRAVGNFHFGHGHGFDPLSLSSRRLYTRRAYMSMSFLYLFYYNFVNYFLPVVILL